MVKKGKSLFVLENFFKNLYFLSAYIIKVLSIGIEKFAYNNAVQWSSKKKKKKKKKCPF